MSVVIDTNVLIVANQQDCPQADAACQDTCIDYLNDHIKSEHVLVIDNGFHILGEYCNKVSPTGEPGVGDAFLKWALTNQGNPSRCQQVQITPTPGGSFEEFPDLSGLAGFDPSDHKFVAVALTHPDRPPVLNAVDSDWLHFQAALIDAGVTVQQLCPETLKPGP